MNLLDYLTEPKEQKEAAGNCKWCYNDNGGDGSCGCRGGGKFFKDRKDSPEDKAHSDNSPSPNN